MKSVRSETLEMIEEKYDFSHISEVKEALDALYKLNQNPSQEERQPLMDAIEGFYRTRTICELFEVYDWSDEKDQTSIHDYPSWLGDAFETEMRTRSLWNSQEMLDVFDAVLPDWSGEESLVRRVAGIQKKLDKIVQLLENFKITMSVKDALEM